MIIQTKYLGEVEISEEQILHFPKGVLGFENHYDFVILDIFENHHFKILQSLKHPEIAFFIINPWDFFKDYEVDIPDEELAKIDILPNKENNFALFNIVTLGQIFKESTANLLAPIIINLDSKKGKQFILNDQNYTTKHKLFPQGTGE